MPTKGAALPALLWIGLVLLQSACYGQQFRIRFPAAQVARKPAQLATAVRTAEAAKLRRRPST